MTITRTTLMLGVGISALAIGVAATLPEGAMTAPFGVTAA